MLDTTAVAALAAMNGTDATSAYASAVASAVRNVQMVRYSELASSAIIVFDFVLTFGEEVDLVWTGAWSLGKALFFANRYYTLCTVAFNNYILFSDALSPGLCAVWLHWQGWTGLIAVMLAEMILLLRLYALYHLDKRVLGLMLAAFALATAASATIMGAVLSRATAIVVTLPTTPRAMQTCAPAGVSPRFYTFWIPIIVFEALLCVLALGRGLHAYHVAHPPLPPPLGAKAEAGAGGRSRWWESGTKLVDVLVRDSVVYFVVMFATYLTNAMVWFLGSESALEVPIGFSVAFASVLGNRLCLSVRSLIAGPGADVVVCSGAVEAVGSTWSEEGDSGIAFAECEVREGEGGEETWKISLTEVEMRRLRVLRASP
ncbi:hypothetical protein PUNSTDRAFT_137297 [Punctularia strigosozonata HHB-11173 SS5]|uniref:uncharacterized protein n=1 Tax=Punctularia strigosozonata (strain HHB-11173) TaxID=741275 RepID=UPI0004417A7D|nr:uncharacterized protein PUNSTDRAFT_137297 [Punctularia strigosozonata HHB-11173 SS5]EIN05812.1 hypothetical protein PUNSTDRAFT_137297 [Punctularia strigosozonata HHB-11173 SS5]